MPIYEYSCPKCGLKFELRRSYSKADEDAPCPKCKCSGKRVFSMFAAKDQWGSFVPGVGNVHSGPARSDTPK